MTAGHAEITYWKLCLLRPWLCVVISEEVKHPFQEVAQIIAWNLAICKSNPNNRQKPNSWTDFDWQLNHLKAQLVRVATQLTMNWPMVSTHQHPGSIHPIIMKAWLSVVITDTDHMRAEQHHSSSSTLVCIPLLGKGLPLSWPRRSIQFMLKRPPTIRGDRKRHS